MFVNDDKMFRNHVSGHEIPSPISQLSNFVCPPYIPYIITARIKLLFK